MTGPLSFLVDDLVIEGGHLLEASAGRVVLDCDPVSRWRGMGAAIGRGADWELSRRRR
jgi:hypothetical protein